MRFALCMGVVAFAAAPLYSQDTTARRLPPVTVTRDKPRSASDIPLAISATKPDSISPGQPHVLVEQALTMTPGLTVSNRNNPAQDARISVRGFGSRSQFGVRSVRVLRDGMPLTMPDGQTAIDYLDLESVGTVETIRGTASSLYGNASGGVIDLRSSPPPFVPISAQVRSFTGTNGLRRNTLLAGGASSLGWYRANIGRTQSDGNRAWSNQELTNAFLRAGASAAGTEFSLIGIGMDMPTAQNPGALTRIQFDTNPDMADPLSVTRKSRKAIHHVQLALQASRPLGGADLSAQVFGGTRALYNPLIPNVVELGRQFSGGSMRAAETFGRQRVTAGVDAQRMSDARKNWAPCNGILVVTANCPTPNVDRGVLTLDQREIVTSLGPYVRDEIDLGRASATLGIRGDNTTFSVTDHFTTDGRDDSGERTMRALSPMAGVSLRVRDQQSVYVNLSTAFETPTTTEMVNKPDSSAGLNPTLKPQRSATMEVGAKGGVFAVLQYDFSIYATRVQDELIGYDIGGGRNAYRNVGRTRRRGAELMLSASWRQLGASLAYTHSEFTFVDSVGGVTPHLRGDRIPGVPRRQVQMSASWRPRYGWALVEWIARDEILVNDANAAAAPGYAITNIRVGTRAHYGKPWLAPVFGVQNLFDRRYVSAVAVNATGTPTSGKFYEPGPGRTWFVGLSAATSPW